MRLIFAISIVLLFQGIGSAQQQIVTTNFLMNNYYYNPAIAGSNQQNVANISYRNQWVGFEDAPVSIMGNYYGSFKNQGKSGYGVSLISDKTGLTQNTGIYLNYAQHVRLSDSIKLGVGVKPGFIQYRVRLYDAQLADKGDEVLTGNILSANALDLQTGFHLYSNKFFFMGAIQHVLGKGIKFTSYNAALAKHFTLIGGYNFQLKQKDIVIQPSFMLKYVKPIPAQWTLMLKGTYQGKYWAGLTYRSQDAAGLCVGYNMNKKLSVGYAFDYSLSGISQYQNGSHEIVISFVTKSKKPLVDEDEELNKSIMEEMQEKMKEKD